MVQIKHLTVVERQGFGDKDFFSWPNSLGLIFLLSSGFFLELKGVVTSDLN